MRTSYTAHELYEHIRSFDVIKFWGSQNKENVIMVAINTTDVHFTAGKKTCYIEAVKRFDSCSFGCCIAGNLLSCEVGGNNVVENLVISSDLGEKSIRVTLEKN